ncbi:MAG: peptidylprolyl isomerase [Candidatus Portnoybacteria bacterium]|nr:peptidylprolyl isomerase [Candidatus Portnoybacteria bacterium]
MNNTNNQVKNQLNNTEKPAGSKIAIGIIGAVIVLAGVAYFIFDRKEPENQNQQNQQNQENQNSGQENQNINESKNFMHVVTIETNYGDIQFETYDADAPKTVQNFINLAQKGFYDNVIFHRVIDGFMIQGGDPLGNGTGGPGYEFEDELNPGTESYKNGYQKGVVAMANRGPNTNGSQFFIMVADYALPNSYSIFGRVVKGQEVADAISKVKTDPANDKPLSAVVMKKVTVSEK